MNQTLRLGARGSLLSRMQSQGVADALMKLHTGLRVELVLIKTSGDRIVDKPLHEAGGKGLFVKELEQALLAGEVDFAVHSYKDVPVTMPLVDQSGLMIAAVPEREDARDVLVSEGGGGILDLPRGAVVGTGSLRRRCQLLAIRDDLDVRLIRGNVDTRLRKQRDGEFTAVVLAMSGLKRAGLFDGKTMRAIETDEMLPAAGQGALALQCRRDDAATAELLKGLNHTLTAERAHAEREVVRLLGGDCHSPIGALATLEGNVFTVKAMVGGRGGELPVIRAVGSGVDALEFAVGALEAQGAKALLHGGS